MARNVNDILFRFLADTKSLERGTKQAKKGLGGVQSAMGSLTKVAGGLGLALGARELVQQFNQAGEAASDFNESVNALEVTTGDAAEDILQLGKSAATGLGLSKTAVNEAAVAFSAFGKQINAEDLAGTFEDYAGRATDFASVMNLEVNDALRIFQSGLAGESEPLRKFGIDMSAASVTAFAYANGIAEAGEKLTETQKIQARYASLMEQTNQLQGDFANTSGELAGQQKILAAEMENARIELGENLLPAMLAVTKAGTGMIAQVNIWPKKFELFSNSVKDLQHRLTFGLLPALDDAERQNDAWNSIMGTAIGRMAKGDKAADTFADAIASVGKETKFTTEFIKTMGNDLDLSNSTVQESIRLLLNNADAYGLTAAQVDALREAQQRLKPDIERSNVALEGLLDWQQRNAVAAEDLEDDIIDVAAALSTFQQAAIDTVARGGSLAQFFRDTANQAADLATATREFNLLFGGGGGSGEVAEPGTSAPQAPQQTFATGGTVAGPRGKAQLAVVHGGETVTPAGRAGGGITIINEFNGVVGDPTAVAEQITDLLEQYTRTNVSF